MTIFSTMCGCSHYPKLTVTSQVRYLACQDLLASRFTQVWICSKHVFPNVFPQVVLLQWRFVLLMMNVMSKTFYDWTGWLLKEFYQRILFAKCSAHDIEVIDRGGGTFQIITISLKGGLSRLIRPRYRPSFVSCMKLSVSLNCRASVKSNGLLLGWFRGSSQSLSS